MINKLALRSDILLLLTALIWGFAFTAQRVGMDYMGPFTFNAVRFTLGSISLLPLIFLRRSRGMGLRDNQSGQAMTAGLFIKKTIPVGCAIFTASTLQQIGIMYTTAGNSGFITGLYVVLTPILAMFIGKKTGIPTWIGAAFTVTGLFFLSAAGKLGNINPGDVITAISAIIWALHVLLIDDAVKRVDAIMLSSGQFAICGLFSFIPALLMEHPTLAALRSGIIPLCYGGFCSVGIAYTLQAVAQKYAPPAHATILLSLEGVFAALGGVLLLHEPLGPYTLLGFILMLTGMLATQWDLIRGKQT